MRDQNRDVPLDFQKMCKQAEYDHETRKLVVLMERLQRQLGQEQETVKTGSPKPPTATMGKTLAWARPRAFFER